MFDELLRGPPGKHGKNGKDGRDGRDGRDGKQHTEAEYIRVNTLSQTFLHEAKVTLPNTVNEFFKISGSTITFRKTGDYHIHFHTLGNHSEYAYGTVVCQMVRKNDGYILHDGRPVQNLNYGPVHFSKDEAIYFTLVYATPDATDPIKGTANIDIKLI